MTSFNININTLSSLFFITNIIHLYYRRKIGYYLFAFLLLVIASLFHHQLDNEITNVFDKITVYLVIIIGGFVTYKSTYNFYSIIIIIITFLLTAYLYFFEIKKQGFITIVKKDKTHENDENYENNTYQNSLDTKYKHALMHCISSIGHHAIIANMSTITF